MAVHFLSDADVATLKKMKRRMAGELPPISRLEEEFFDNTPEFYVVKLPEEGIPAATQNGSIVPGHAECELYYLGPESEGGDYHLLAATDDPDTPAIADVYNFHRRPWFAFSKYITVARDNFGVWHCAPPPTNYRAILLAQLVQGGSSSVAVFYRLNGVWEAAPDTITDVVEFTLNLSEYWPQYQKGWVQWDEGDVWVFDSTACPVADDTGLLP